MATEARLEELRARLDLARGTPTLLLAIAESDAALDEVRRLLLAILAATPIQVADLGACDLSTGPARWVELTRSRGAEAFLLTASPQGPLGATAFAGLLNAEREFLRQLSGPVVLLVSRATEQALRRRAPDFMTWAAQAYELPRPDDLVELAGRLGAAPEIVHPVTPEEEPIRFLHISDLHLRPQRVRRYDQDRVLRGLIDFLARDRDGFPLDLIFVTGDLAHGGKADEYAVVVEFLRRLLEVTGVPPEGLFVVPGNHDVDREVGKWLLRTLGSDEDAIRFFEEAESRRFHAQKLEAYRKSMTELLGPGRALGLGVGADAVEIVALRGARLAVASFNSAWFAQGDDDEGNLWLGEANVDGAEGRIAEEGATFAIALLHHPFDDLHEIEREAIERRCERVFDVVLRGHLHQTRTRSIAAQRGGFVEVAGPAAYQGSQWPNGCFLGEIRPRQRSVRLRPYAYSGGADPWVLNTSVFPDDEKDGYCHTFQVPEKRRLSRTMGRLVQRAAEAAVSAAPAAVREELSEQLEIQSPVGARVVGPGSRGTIDPGSRSAGSPGSRLTRGVAETLRTAFAGAMGDNLAEGQGSAIRIQRSDPDFLEKGLLAAAQIVQQTLGESGLGKELKENAYIGLFHAALSSVLEGPVAFDIPLGDDTTGHRYRADILIGYHDDEPARRAIIEFVQSRSPLKLAQDLQKLAHYLGILPAHGALVVIGSAPPGPAGYRVERVKSAGNRDVLLLQM